MLAKRIIPCLDVQDGRVVKGVHFVGLRDAGDPVEQARPLRRRGRRRDRAARHHARRTRSAARCSTSSRVRRTLTFVPLTVGGGVRDEDDVRALLGRGRRQGEHQHRRGDAPRARPRGAASAWGAQAIVVAIDAKRRPDGRGWEVFVHGGRTSTGLDAVAWAEQAALLGAGEILLTSMDRDGTQAGYDLALTRAVSDAVPVPVIASGGVGTLEHLRAGLVEGRASAVLAASIFHDGKHSIAEAKAFLAARGRAREALRRGREHERARRVRHARRRLLRRRRQARAAGAGAGGLPRARNRGARRPERRRRRPEERLRRRGGHGRPREAAARGRDGRRGDVASGRPSRGCSRRAARRRRRWPRRASGAPARGCRGWSRSSRRRSSR